MRDGEEGGRGVAICTEEKMRTRRRWWVIERSIGMRMNIVHGLILDLSYLKF